MSNKRGPPPKPPKPSTLQAQAVASPTTTADDDAYYRGHNPFSATTASVPTIPLRPSLAAPAVDLPVPSTYSKYSPPEISRQKSANIFQSQDSKLKFISDLQSSAATSHSIPPSTTQYHSSSEDMQQLDLARLSELYTQFTQSEISAFYLQFKELDKNARGAVHSRDLTSLSTKAGVSYQDVVSKLSALHLTSSDETVDFESFLKSVSSILADKGARKGDTTKIRLHGTSENTTHTINEDEKQSFVTHINQQLLSDPHLKNLLPIDPSSMQIFADVKDGLILAKLINDSVPNTIDERALNIPTSKKLSAFQMHENNNVVINSAKAIGCSVVNIGASDLIEGREHLVLGLIWQIIKMGLSAKVDIKVHPELFRLLYEDETLESFLKLGTEQILLRWFNYHLKKAGWDRVVKNFSSDVKDGQNYTVLLNQLAPSLCSRHPLQEPNVLQRAEQVLQNADKLGCRKYLTAKTMVEGNQKLNFAFVANLFNNHPGLDPLDETEMANIDEGMFGEGSREARAFALWLNSLGVDPFVNNLFDDLSDGLVLLQAIDYIHPGMVDWKKVNRPATSKFKKVENTNYCIVLGKSLKFTLVGVQGSDITDGVKILILGFVWQLMRDHIVQTLLKLSTTRGGKEITDNDIISWANATIQKSGKTSKIQSFKDSSLRSGIYFLDLMNGIKKGIVNYELVTPGVSDEDAAMNAKYAISIARKLGATIFVLPEDIVEVKPKMMLTFVGTLMALAGQGV